MASRRNVPYSPLPVDEYDGTSGRKHDPRFDYNPRSFDRVPWKSIALALFLLCLGSLLLFLSVFILTGHMGGEKSQGYGLLALGVLTFLPAFLLPALFVLLFAVGFYETRIAYYSWREVEGYRFAAIPDY